MLNTIKIDFMLMTEAKRNAEAKEACFQGDVTSDACTATAVVTAP